VGVLAVAVSAYLAAVYLAADAVRHGDDELAAAFRRRALGAGAVGGLAAAVGIVVLRFDAHRLFDRLIWGPGTPAVVVSVLAGVATLALVTRRRFEPARYTAALAVAAVVAGWALGQNPLMLRDLTVSQAAASRSSLIAVLVAVVAGGVLLFPSLALLFRLTLGGRLGQGPVAEEAAGAPGGVLGSPRLALRLAGALLILGVGLTTVADGPWAHGFGVAALLGFVVAGVIAVGPAGFAAAGDDRV
jgi:cytochrome d ubiquinol oxidase subunit II